MMQLKAEVCFFYVKMLNVFNTEIMLIIPNHPKRIVFGLKPFPQKCIIEYDFCHQFCSWVPQADFSANLSCKQHVTNLELHENVTRMQIAADSDILFHVYFMLLHCQNIYQNIIKYLQHWNQSEDF